MEAWLFVEEGRQRLNLSANAFCKRAHLRWVTGGLVSVLAGAFYRKEVNGETLRRRYQEACAFLRTENRPYVSLKELLGAQNPQFDGVSPTQKLWQQVLNERLAVSR